ncbi:hypothetical protein T06_8139 [Trichinella sp. T6]|nr:hypothetical protein T06_8139 [Trichinella sp. T6]
MPGAKFQKISKFSKNCLRHSPRRSLRAYKNLHITLRRLKICIKIPSVRNCEDESRILNDLHRITAIEIAEGTGEVDKVLQDPGTGYSKKYLRQCRGGSLRGNENFHIYRKANIVQ